jgi:hypothetical protein
MEQIYKFLKNSSIEKIKDVLKHFRISDDNDIKMLANHAVRAGRLDVLKHIKELYDFDFSYDDQRLLIIAIMQEQYDIVKYLLTLPEVDPTVGNNDALRIVNRYNNAQIKKLLLSDPRVIKKLTMEDIYNYDLAGEFMELYNIDREEDINVILMMLI